MPNVSLSCFISTGLLRAPGNICACCTAYQSLMDFRWVRTSLALGTLRWSVSLGTSSRRRSERVRSYSFTHMAWYFSRYTSPWQTPAGTAAAWEARPTQYATWERAEMPGTWADEKRVQVSIAALRAVRLTPQPVVVGAMKPALQVVLALGSDRYRPRMNCACAAVSWWPCSSKSSFRRETTSLRSCAPPAPAGSPEARPCCTRQSYLAVTWVSVD